MKRIVMINDVELTVYFSTTEFRAATFKRPADGGEIEIEGVYIDGNAVGEMLADWVNGRIVEQLREAAGEMKLEAQQAEAERRADEARDMQMYREAA